MGERNSVFPNSPAMLPKIQMMEIEVSKRKRDNGDRDGGRNNDSRERETAFSQTHQPGFLRYR